MSCPVCSATEVAFLTRTEVPVHQNLIMKTFEAARAIRRGTLEMAVCETCGFAFNRAFDASLLAYGDDYDNTQDHSPSFKSYTDGLVERLVGLGVRDARVVEVGCGKGQFIQRLVEASPNTVGWGFDPSYVGPEELLQGRLKFRREFYGPGCESLLADVVVCRHVIELLPSMKAPTVSKLHGDGGYAVETVVERRGINVLIPALKDAGASDIIELPLAKIVH